MEKQQGLTFIDGVMMEQIMPSDHIIIIVAIWIQCCIFDMFWHPGNPYSIIHVMTIHTPSIISYLSVTFVLLGPHSNERLGDNAWDTLLMSLDSACKLRSDPTINHILVGLFETFVLWAPQPVKWLEVQLRWHDNPRCLIQSNRYIFQKQHCFCWK